MVRYCVAVVALLLAAGFAVAETHTGSVDELTDTTVTVTVLLRKKKEKPMEKTLKFALGEKAAVFYRGGGKGPTLATLKAVCAERKDKLPALGFEATVLTDEKGKATEIRLPGT